MRIDAARKSELVLAVKNVLGLVYLACGKLIPAMAPRRPTDRPPVDRPINRPAGLLSRAWRLERRRLSRGGPLPYAVAIAAGGFPAELIAFRLPDEEKS